MDPVPLPQYFAENPSPEEAERLKQLDEGRIADYTPLRKKTLEWMIKQDGVQHGDPIKAAHAIVDVVCGEGLAVPIAQRISNGQDECTDGTSPPLPELLVLGEDAEVNIRDRCMTVLKCLEEWKDVTRSISH